MTKRKVLVYFLPQFHECEYNNKWWGKGFTEWQNVKFARPLKLGHIQPRVPINGYYDLLKAGELEKQYTEAKAHGVTAFVLYHYWYSEKRPLGKPLDLILNAKDIDFQFSLCWANHAWTRSWRNRAGSLDILIDQTYDNIALGAKKHFEYLARAFTDERYTRIEGKPLFQIYIPEDVSNIRIFIQTLRSYMATNHSLELHLSATIRSRLVDYSFLEYFDSATLAQPGLGMHSPKRIFGKNTEPRQFSKSIRSYILMLPKPLKKLLFRIQDIFPKKATYYDYDEVWQNAVSQSKIAAESCPIPVNFTAFVDFDNTPRYGKAAKVIEGFTPQKFKDYTRALLKISALSGSHALFVNAWNEWGEGMYLEGDSKYPVERLLALSDAISDSDLNYE
jgi:hypothetical protein